MRLNLTKFFFVLGAIILTLSNRISAQCNESQATLQQTNEWFNLILEENSGRDFPPTIYRAKFEGCKVIITEIGVSDLSIMKYDDTVQLVSFTYSNLNIDDSYIRDIGNKNKKFGYEFYSRDLIWVIDWEESGFKDLDDAMENMEDFYNVSNLGFEVIFKNRNEQNLDQRLLNALKHAKCLCGEGEKAKVKSTF